ncbi:MAG: SUMF1/EgtB/PvdO family nonheme iron enzyme [Polyangiaceae bacterium]
MNFCDAKAFCAWAGKRLCGKIGGGSLVVSGGFDRGSHREANSEWYSACARGSAMLAYPYGDSYEQGACNIGVVTSNYGTVDVASDPKCVGGYPGIYDMTGNVMEWIDVCEPENSDPKLTRCLAQGGPWNFDKFAATCDFAEVPQRQDNTTPQIGFRCCKD